MKRTIYMKVSDDKYELPVAIADTQRDLARKVGLKEASLRSIFCRIRKGFEFKQYRIVEIDDEL